MENMKEEQLDTLAMHITDTYMSSVVAARDTSIDAKSYAEHYLRAYTVIENTVLLKFVQSKTESMGAEDTLASKFK